MVMTLSLHGMKRGKPDGPKDNPVEKERKAKRAKVKSSHNLTHYAIIFLDHDGNLCVEESASIRKTGRGYFTTEMREKFKRIIDPTSHEDLFDSEPRRYSLPYIEKPRTVQRDIVMAPGINKQVDLHDSPSWLTQRQNRSRRALDFSILPAEQKIEPVYVQPMEPSYQPTRVGFAIGDTEKVLAYYENALKHFQQINCRKLAKAWIKCIQPKKQVNYPYNQGEKKKPEWWPDGVMHKEPDHLKKGARMQLLIHIIRNHNEPDKLRDIALEIKRQIEPEDRVDIIEEIFRVRRLEQQLERDEVDPETIIYVVKRDPNARHTRDDSEADDTMAQTENEAILQAPDEDQELSSTGMPTPQSSDGTISELPNSSAKLNILTSSQQLDPENTGIFPLHPSFTFDQTTSFNSSHETMGTGCGSDFGSQPMTRSSTTSSTLGPEISRSYGFFGQTPVAQASSVVPTHVLPQHPGTYIGWPQSFQPGYINLMDYNSGSTSEVHQLSHFTGYSSFPNSQTPTVAPHQTQSSHHGPVDKAS